MKEQPFCTSFYFFVLPLTVSLSASQFLSALSSFDILSSSHSLSRSLFPHCPSPRPSYFLSFFLTISLHVSIYLDIIHSIIIYNIYLADAPTPRQKVFHQLQRKRTEKKIIIIEKDNHLYIPADKTNTSPAE